MTKFKVGDLARIVLQHEMRSTTICWQPPFSQETQEDIDKLESLYVTYVDVRGVLVRVIELSTPEDSDILIEFPCGARAEWSPGLLQIISPLERLAMEAE